jgi:hypothetical protein
MRTRLTAMMALLGVLALSGCHEGPQGDDWQTTGAEPGMPELTILRPGADASGSLDPSWRTHTTGGGRGSTWTGERDASAPSRAPVFVMRPRIPGDSISTAVSAALAASDVTLNTSLKVVDASGDSGGGLVWRYRDEGNCYFCGVGPASGDFIVYVVRDWTPRLLASTKTTLDPALWHSVVVKHVGARIVCTLDEDIVIAAVDDSLAGSGAVGLWTGGHGEVRFTSVRATKRR